VTPAPAAAPPRAAPTPLPVATAGGSFAVNVGSYANVANAESLLNRLRNAGIAAYAESVSLDGRAVRRVRLGPFAQRAEAERARQAALGLQRDLPTSIINLDAGSSVPPPARPAVAAGFAVQLGALRSEIDANALRDRARGAGFVAFVERVNADAGVLWRVRVGPELDRASADRRRAELKSRLSIDGLVVSHP
jgi:DedD protein